MTTLLAIDIGNTNVSLGLFDYPASGAATLSEHWRIGTHREQTSDETALTVRALFRQVDRKCEEVTNIAISRRQLRPRDIHVRRRIPGTRCRPDV